MDLPAVGVEVVGAAAVVEQVGHRAAETVHDCIGGAAGVAADQHPAFDRRDTQRRVGVVMGRALGLGGGAGVDDGPPVVSQVGDQPVESCCGGGHLVTASILWTLKQLRHMPRLIGAGAVNGFPHSRQQADRLDFAVSTGGSWCAPLPLWGGVSPPSRRRTAIAQQSRDSVELFAGERFPVGDDTLGVLLKFGSGLWGHVVCLCFWAQKNPDDCRG